MSDKVILMSIRKKGLKLEYMYVSGGADNIKICTVLEIPPDQFFI